MRVGGRGDEVWIISPREGEREIKLQHFNNFKHFCYRDSASCLIRTTDLNLK